MIETAAPDGAERPGSSGRRRRPRLRRVLVVVDLGGTAIYAYTIERRITSNITRGVELPAGSESARPPAQETGVLSYVLLGSDSRDDADPADGRSDTLMVVHLNKKRTKAYIVSFPRDMYVTIPGHGKNKINAAYAEGGPALSLRLNGSDIELLQAPLAGFSTINGQSVDLVDTATKAELAAALKDDEMAAYVKKHPPSS